MRFAMLLGAVILGLAALAVALVDPTPGTMAVAVPEDSAPVASDPDFAYRHYTVDAGKASPEACLVFSEPLGEGALADYVTVEGANPAVRADGAALCLAGLGFGRDYAVTVAQGLPAASGRRLETPQWATVSLGEQPAFVGFSGSGYVLPRRTTPGLPIETINVSEVSIKVLRVGDRLLARELRETWTGGRLYRYAVETLEEDRSTLVWQGRMAVERRHNQRVVTQFPLAEAIGDRKPGAYLVVVDNADRRAGEEDDRWGPVATRWVVDTDIGLTTLSGEHGLTVQARSLASAQPLAGIRLALIATNNDELAIVTTDAEGRAHFAPGLLRGSGGAAPSVAMAYGDDDFALIDLKRPAFDLSDRGVDGRPASGPVDAFLYADRGIYRPGERAHVVTLLRDRLGVALAGQRATLVVRRPNGTEFGRFPGAAEAAGALPLELDLPHSAARGVWAVEAYLDTAADPVGRVEFEVQDFVPQRLAVEVTSPDTVLRPGAAVTVALAGRFLYGAPAADLPVEAELRIEELHSLPQAKGYLFGRFDDRFEPVSVPLEAGAADAEGRATAVGRLELPKLGNRPLRGIVTAGMVEPGGRATKAELVLPVAARDLYLGVRPLFPDLRAPMEGDAQFEIMAFDSAGLPRAAAGVEVTVYAEEWFYDWSRRNGVWQHTPRVESRVLKTDRVDLAADKPATRGWPVDWGRYRIEVRDLASGVSTAIRFRAGWSDNDAVAETPDRVEVGAEKPVYRIGDTVRVAIRPPFDGEATVMVATDRVLYSRNLSVAATGTTLDLPVESEWGSGAYVLVSAYRPLVQRKPHEPARAVGLAWIGVDMSARTLAVTLDAPETVAPRRRLDVPVTVAGAAGEATFLTLAAVDEGILQLTQFQTPDPAAHYFGKRQLGVDLRDDYGRLLSGGGAPGRIRSGGDGMGGAGLAVVPTRTVALFSGTVALDAGGRATVPLDIPDFNGQLRLMAVAHSRSRVGQGEGRVTVRDPVVAEVVLPRFLAPGDEGRATLLVHNLSGAPGEYRVRLSATGAVRLGATAAERPFSLADGQRTTEPLGLVAGAPGIGTVALEIEGPGFVLTRGWQIAVRAPHFPISLQEVAMQDDGERFAVDPDLLDAFLPGTAEVTVNYSPLADLDIPGLLRSLYRYPYGCSEQISSVAMPLLQFTDPALLGVAAGEVDAVRERVGRAIDTLLERQDGEGEFGLYRPGDGWASPYVTAQVVDFLASARAAGYAVPEGALQSAYARLRGEIAREEPYALYVLAREGQVDVGSLRYFADNRLKDTTPGMQAAHLAAALALVGESARARRAFAVAEANIGKSGPHDWYASEARDFAALLALAAETRRDEVVERLLPRLRQHVPANEAANTQEKLWLLRAAAALVRGDAGSFEVNGVLQAGAGSGATAFQPSREQVQAGYALTNRSGRGVWRSLVISGTPAIDPPPLAEGFVLEKHLFHLDGRPVETEALRQNDRFIVSLQGRMRGSASRTAVVADLLPAGWEIEAVLQRGPEGRSDYAFLPPLSTPLAAEARDDRFVAMLALGERPTHQEYWMYEEDDEQRRRFHLAYMVRAVTPGRYVQPAAVVENMYRPTDMARTAVGRTAVGGP